MQREKWPQMLSETKNPAKNRMPEISLHISSAAVPEKIEDAPHFLASKTEDTLHSSVSETEGILSRVKLHFGEQSLPCDRDLVMLRKSIRRRLSWSENELMALIHGVESLGTGNWTEILNTYKGVFHPARRVVDLVDKYKQYSKSTSFYRTPKRNWVELGDDMEPKKNSQGRIASCAEKFPYVAAVKFLKKLKLVEHKPSKIIVRDVVDASSIHMYSFSISAGKIHLKKLTFK